MNNMKIQFNLRHICTLLMLAGLGQSGMFGQAIGVEVVVDTAFYGPNTPTPEDALILRDFGWLCQLLGLCQFHQRRRRAECCVLDIGFYPQEVIGLNAPADVGTP